MYSIIRVVNVNPLMLAINLETLTRYMYYTDCRPLDIIEQHHYHTAFLMHDILYVVHLLDLGVGKGMKGSKDTTV